MNFRRELISKKLLKKNNKTTIFLLPTYGYPLKLYSNYFIGCYIKDKDNYIISFVFENAEDSEALRPIIQMLSVHHDYIDMNFDGQNAEELVVDMKLDKEYHKDFKSILDGRYSEISEQLKDILMGIHGKKNGVGLGMTMYETLYPTIIRRNDLAKHLNVDYKHMPHEVLDVPNMDYEQYLTIEQLKEKYGTKQQTIIGNHSL